MSSHFQNLVRGPVEVMQKFSVFLRLFGFFCFGFLFFGFLFFFCWQIAFVAFYWRKYLLRKIIINKILLILLFLTAKKLGSSIPETKSYVGFRKICRDCKTNFNKSTFTRKFRKEIYCKSTFLNFQKTYVTPQKLEKVSKTVKFFLKFAVV